MELTKKKYKKTEVGLIPVEWSMKTLGDIGEVRMCKRVFSHETKPTGYIPFYKIGTFGKEPDAYITIELFNNYRKKFSFPQKGDILISAAGTIGRTIVYNGDFAYFQDSNIVWIENIGKLVSNEYLQFVFQVVKYQTEGGTIQRLYNNILKKTNFACPPLTEQRAIATALSDVDELITNLEKLIQKKKAIKQGAMQQLLTPPHKGGKRLEGFTGDWEEKTIEEICDCLDYLRIPLNENDRAQMKGDIPYCGANGVVDYVNNHLIDDDIILIAEDGGYFDEFMKRPIAYQMKGKCWVNNHAHILKAKSNTNQDFVYYSIVHKNILDFITGGTRAKLNKSELFKITIWVPTDLREQYEISRILKEIDIELAAVHSKITKLSFTKQGMMQELLTGKTRLV